MVTLVLKSLALALCMASSSAQQWKQLTAAAPWAGRSDPQLVHLNGKLLLMGGHDGTKASNYFNDVSYCHLCYCCQPFCHLCYCCQLLCHLCYFHRAQTVAVAVGVAEPRCRQIVATAA